jgi:hypothetical protein
MPYAPSGSNRNMQVDYYYLTVKVTMEAFADRLCGVARVPGYRSRGPGFDFRRYQIF